MPSFPLALHKARHTATPFLQVSDGCMEFIHPQLIECLLCQQTFNLHQPFNMCRAIRHLKAKHPNLMPEYAGLSQFEDYDEDEDSLNAAAAMQRPAMGTTLGMLGHDNIIYNTTMLPVEMNPDAASGGMVYGVQPMARNNEEEEEEAEEIVIAAGRAFDVEPATPYAQQFVTNAPSEPSTPAANRSELGTLLSVHGGIRVFRTPQHARVYYQNNSNYQPSMASSMAAKNAKLDHGAIVRQYPPTPQSAQGSMMIGRRMLETPMVYQQQQVQPRQFYLLIQPAPNEDVMPQNMLNPSVDPSMITDQPSDRVLDESMMESQKLAELMSQANEEHRQPHELMAGDDPLM